MIDESPSPYTVKQIDDETCEVFISLKSTILVSPEDVEAIARRRWRYNGGVLGSREKLKPFCRLSAFILGIPPLSTPRVVIRHINGNKLDFRRGNLVAIPVTTRKKARADNNPNRIACLAVYNLIEENSEWIDEFIAKTVDYPLVRYTVRHHIDLLKASLLRRSRKEER